MSKNYQKTLKKYHKWLNRKNNKTQNAYHQFSKYLVKKYDTIIMEDLNNQRNVPKHQMVTKTTKNWIIQTTKHDKIQIRMVWKNIHTNRQILSIKQKMQHLRIPKKQPNTQNTSMEMPHLRNTPPQRHQRSKKHLKRRTKNTKSYKHVTKKYFFTEPISRWGIA